MNRRSVTWVDDRHTGQTTSGVRLILSDMASKTLAEKAAWEFVDANKSKISWDFVAINPPWIFGASSLLFCYLFFNG